IVQADLATVYEYDQGNGTFTGVMGLAGSFRYPEYVTSSVQYSDALMRIAQTGVPLYPNYALIEPRVGI
ncbi:MAG: hypothetical protein WBQ76_08855, partial [Candidatus Korobacteraceae bacterium]